MNPKVNFYFNKATQWQEELKALRKIVLDCDLTEELKWGVPCYTIQVKRSGGKSKISNIVLMHVFKEYCALLFFKGALLDDADGLLVQQTENVQAARQIRFTNLREIVKHEAILKNYIFEAIEVEKAGIQVEFKKTQEYEIPEEFTLRLKKDPVLKNAFEALTPGRQRGYLLYFSAAKQSKTRESRIEKYLPEILAGRGLNDK